MLTLTCMTYNIRHGAGNDQCITPNPDMGEAPVPDCALDLDRIARVIRAESPNVIATQELDRFWARSGYSDQPAELAKLLDMNVAFGANLREPPNEHSNLPHQYGLAVFTGLPILHSCHRLLSTSEGREQRGLLDVRVAVPEVGEIAIVNTHLQSDEPNESGAESIGQRQQQAAEIAAYISGLTVPAVLMGDFNADLTSSEMDSLTSESSPVIDVWKSAGTAPPLTFPAHPLLQPQAHIDHIFIGPEISVESARVVRTDLGSMASDHYPVVATLELRTA